MRPQTRHVESGREQAASIAEIQAKVRRIFDRPRADAACIVRLRRRRTLRIIRIEVRGVAIFVAAAQLHRRISLFGAAPRLRRRANQRAKQENGGKREHDKRAHDSFRLLVCDDSQRVAEKVYKLFANRKRGGGEINIIG